MRRTWAIWIVLCSTGVASADQIVLRDSAAVEAGPVRLKDVAHLYGPEAQRLAEATVAPAGTERLTMDRIRTALAPHAPRWSELIFKGALEIRIETKTRTEVPDRGDRVEPEQGAANVSMLRRGEGPREAKTIRQRIERWLLGQTTLDVERLKIEFESDALELIAQNVGSGRLEIRPIGDNRLGRVSLHVRVLDRGRPVVDGRVVCSVQARRQVLVAAHSIPSGRLIAAGDVQTEQRWIDSSYLKPVTDPSGVVGRRLERSKRSGSILEKTDLREEVVIRRGQIVRLKSYSGPLVIQTSARAMESGSMNQWITVRNEKSRKKLRGRVTGPQEVTVSIGTETDKPSARNRRKGGAR
ncbi:MAG: flagellar basal body P-ring formation chaperone FlgA [Phycisphaeraceae bacterium]|nr:flagellar basal body P-ring formation chaperone FlgA [Phycisphaeraceae bacterium]